MQRNFNLCTFTLCLLFSVFCSPSCTSGMDESMRNKDVFDEARSSTATISFTTEPTGFMGNIAGLVSDIGAIAQKTGETTNNNPLVTNIADTSDLSVGHMIFGSGTQLPVATVATVGANQITMTVNATAAGTNVPLIVERTYTGTNATIEGIVSMPSNYGLALGSHGCTTMNGVFSRSFILQDASAGILVAYGLEPPLQNPSQSTSMKYIHNSRVGNMAVFGDRLRLTVTRVLNYGSGANVIPVITDFSNPVIVSRNNRISYSEQTGAFVRGSDLNRLRRLEGYVSASPSKVECTSGSTRQFQFNYQQGYIGKLCVGTISGCTSVQCTCTGTEYQFQMSLYLGAGTLSGFDTGDMFSYNIAKGAKVRMTGPVYVPQFAAADSALSLMLGQRVQVETLP